MGLTMDFFLNELSIHNQFTSQNEFLESLKTILKCKKLINDLKLTVCCHREIVNQHVLNNVTLSHAINKFADKNLKRIVMIWISKHGPFMDDSRQHSPDEYFQYKDEVVTDCSLGEAAYRISFDNKAASISFTPSKFLIDPIPVIWNKIQTKITIHVPNFWNISSLNKLLQSLKKTGKLVERIIGNSQK
jgi:hypothetical protein